MLEVRELSCAYGQVQAVENVSLNVAAGQMVVLLGPNGAGKTSIIQCLAGHVAQIAGSIRFQGEDIGRLPASKRAGLGIAVAPEGRRLFPDLTVRENLSVGGYCRPKSREAGNVDKVLDLFPRLRERLHAPARLLSGGEQQIAAIGRALMAEPSLIMIDEVSLGLMPKMVDVCYDAIAQLRRDGTAVLIVEQNTDRAMESSDFAYVLQSGNVVWEGVPSIEQKDSIVSAYLGAR